ncbi:YjcZ family sporulation protein [Brevibacillus ginsengisoli]
MYHKERRGSGMSNGFFGDMFTLVLVLFILLVIVGASEN